jgi:MFS transporter, DHA3 family, macrolide efflux protein
VSIANALQRAAKTPLAVLECRPFRRLWAANLISSAGSQMSRIALILFLSDHGGGILPIGVLLLCETLPGTVAGLMSGTLVDRYSKRDLMVWSDLIRFIVLVGAILIPTATTIYVVAAISSFTLAFFAPARSACIPLLIPQDNLTQANSMDQGAANVLMILAPVMGAELYLSTGIRVTLSIDALSYILSALLVMPLDPCCRPASRLVGPTSIVNECKEGWRYLSRNPLVLYLLGLCSLSLLCAGLWLPLAPLFIHSFLKSPARLLGIQLSLFGLGGICGSICAALFQKSSLGKLLFLCLVGEGAVMIAYSVAAAASVSAAIMFVWGGIVSVMMVPYNTLLQTIVQSGFLGRVFTVSRQIENLALIVAIALGTALQHRFRADQMFLFAGLLYVSVVGISGFTRYGTMLFANTKS